ncbi:uncharacterized protein LOC122373883 [Amphibalanus amphitrite]|nr:uncharacterized protein LOC122373883 [Amphibalanus amphitrite]
MTVRNGTTRFYKASDFHRNRRVRGVCRGGQYRQRRPRAGLDLSRRAMDGVPLKILYTDIGIKYGSQNIQSIHRDGNITGGFTGSVILNLQEVLGFSYSLHEIKEWGNMSVWDQAVEMLHQGQGDMLAGRMLITSSRLRLVDYSFPLMSDVAGAAIDSRYTLTLTEFQVTQPLETPVWTALLVTQLLAVLVLCLIARCQQRIRSASGEPSDAAEPSFWALIVLGVSCQQGAAVRSDTANSYRVAIAALYWASLFIVACYSGNLLAEMTMARRVMPFDSLQEALEQGWQFTESGMSMAVREAIVKPLMGRDIDRLPMVSAGPLEGRNIQLGAAVFSQFNNNCTNLGRDEVCPVCLWPGSVTRVPMALIFRPHFPYLKLINYLLPRLVNQGIIDRELRRWTSFRASSMLCQAGGVAPLQMSALGLSNLRNVMAIVGFGILCSGIALLLEWLVRLISDWYESKKMEQGKARKQRKVKRAFK